MSCHMGFDHPDAESYGESKMGQIYHMQGEQWDWEKPLAEIMPGKDYRTPTCQFCHFDQGNGKFARNPVTNAGKVSVVGPVLGLHGLFARGRNNPSEIEITYADL